MIRAPVLVPREDECRLGLSVFYFFSLFDTQRLRASSNTHTTTVTPLGGWVSHSCFCTRHAFGKTPDECVPSIHLEGEEQAASKSTKALGKKKNSKGGLR